MSIWTELHAWWFTILSQVFGSKYYGLRARGLQAHQARNTMLRNGIRPKLRYTILKRDYFTCQKCGRRPPQVTLEVDHITPLSLGGTNNEKNLTTLCTWCNRGKGATS